MRNTVGLRAWRRLPVALALITVMSCGDGSSEGGDEATLSFDLPTVRHMGGIVLRDPRVQPIYLSDFPYGGEIDRFLQRMAGSTYWTDVVGEYGVGRPVILPGDASTVEVPASVDAERMEELLNQVLAANPALGRPRPDTIYVLFFSPSTAVTVSGYELCNGIDAFHMEATIAKTTVPLAVIPACESFSGDDSLTGAEALTVPLSHELIEAATDPFPFSNPAYADVDDAHAMWSVAIGGGELADLCGNESPNRTTPEDIGFPVQRSWSNKAAKAGKGPCVPVPSGEGYFSAVGRMSESVEVEFQGGGKVRVPSLIASAGTSATLSVDFRGESHSPVTWEVLAIEDQGGSSVARALAEMRKPMTGNRGDTHSVEVLAPSGSRSGIFPLLVLSHSSAGEMHLWVGTITRR